MSSIHVTIPIVFWGRNPPVHDITCITRTDDDEGVATGTKSGQICLWDLYRIRNSHQFVLRPRLLLCGPKHPIISLAIVRNWSGDRHRIVSLTNNGFLSLWDGKDGTCLKINQSLGDSNHSGVKCLPREGLKETLIAVWGQYSSVFILDSITLDLICVLKSSHNPNWISQICFIPNVDKKDALVAMTTDGILKLWLLHSIADMREMVDLFEEKSKALGISQPLSLASESVPDCSIALVVCRDTWQVYDVSEGRTKQLLIRGCEENVNYWTGGEFLSYKMLLVWSDNGRGYLYELDSQILPGVPSNIEQDEYVTTAGCVLRVILGPNEPHCDVMDVSSLTYSYATFLSHRWHILGDSCGRLQVWHVDSVLRNLPSSSQPDDVPVVTCHLSSSISDSWSPPANPCSLIDALYPDDTSCSPNITCSLFLPKFGRLICGLSNGDIAVISATQAATRLLLQRRKFSRAWPQHYYLRGHSRPITSLLYPSKYSEAYNNNYLLSGGADFSVRLWDLYKGTLVHTFVVHGGAVIDIITCPSDCNTRIQTCVCSIGNDHSVAILSTSQNKCLLLASCHTSPVISVHWRLQEDFLLVNCSGGRLYVWQIETGTLDRCVEGDRAKIILDGTTASTKPPAPPTSPSPIQVQSVSIGDDNSDLIQILLFDPQCLINRLQKMEKVVSKPRPVAKPAQAMAFRTYISARRNYSFTEQGGAQKTPPSTQKYIPSMVGSSSPSSAHMKALERIGDSVGKGIQQEVIQPEPLDMTINTARLLVSCLHAWNLDEQLDKECEESLGLVRPVRNVSFGLISKGGALSLVLPGWGLVNDEGGGAMTTPTKKRPVTIAVSPGVKKGDLDILKHLVTNETSSGGRLSIASSPPPMEDTHAVMEGVRGATGDRGDVTTGEGEGEDPLPDDLLYHIRWRLSSSLTTQHLLTVVSITNTLMNQSCGAHALATSSGSVGHRVSESTESDVSSDDEDDMMRDNMIRAIWSRVAVLHCVMLPERMAGYFRPPHLPILASRFMDPTQAIREAAQTLLQSELRRVDVSGRKSLVNAWASKLATPPTFSRSRSKPNDDEYGDHGNQATPTQQQQMTALVILGMIGSEFNTETKATPKSHKRNSKKKKDSPKSHISSSGQPVEILDPSVARQTAKTLQMVLLDRPPSKISLYSSLRCSAAELMGRGFHLWENYVDVPHVVMGLLDLAIHPSLVGGLTQPTDDRMAKKIRSAKFLSDIARRALNLMVLLRPLTIVNALAKEVSLYLGSQHGTTFPHSSLPPIQVGHSPPPNTPGIVTPANTLLVAAKEEILDLIRTILDKCSSLVSSQLLDVVNIVLFCLEQDELKKRHFNELFPSLMKLPNVSYSPRTKRLAVGSRSGQVEVYDLKARKTQMVNAHTHQVTVVCFSEDGKLLATYSYGDSTLRVWNIGTQLFGGIIGSTPKCIHSWPAISSSSSANASYSNYVRLEWASSKIIVLFMPGGIEYRYSL